MKVNEGQVPGAGQGRLMNEEAHEANVSKKEGLFGTCRRKEVPRRKARQEETCKQGLMYSRRRHPGH